MARLFELSVYANSEYISNKQWGVKALVCITIESAPVHELGASVYCISGCVFSMSI